MKVLFKLLFGMRLLLVLGLEPITIMSMSASAATIIPHHPFIGIITMEHVSNLYDHLVLLNIGFHPAESIPIVAAKSCTVLVYSSTFFSLSFFPKTNNRTKWSDRVKLLLQCPCQLLWLFGYSNRNRLANFFNHVI
ncbi:hypothetical protein DsansV1_C08g0082351 [Dioscorea sansibarensis]